MPALRHQLVVAVRTYIYVHRSTRIASCLSVCVWVVERSEPAAAQELSLLLHAEWYLLLQERQPVSKRAYNNDCIHDIFLTTLTTRSGRFLFSCGEQKGWRQDLALQSSFEFRSSQFWTFGSRWRSSVLHSLQNTETPTILSRQAFNYLNPRWTTRTTYSVLALAVKSLTSEHPNVFTIEKVLAVLHSTSCRLSPACATFLPFIN